jgi:hypothetical protein
MHQTNVYTQQYAIYDNSLVIVPSTYPPLNNMEKLSTIFIYIIISLFIDLSQGKSWNVKELIKN